MRVCVVIYVVLRIVSVCGVLRGRALSARAHGDGYLVRVCVFTMLRAAYMHMWLTIMLALYYVCIYCYLYTQHIYLYEEIFYIVRATFCERRMYYVRVCFFCEQRKRNRIKWSFVSVFSEQRQPKGRPNRRGVSVDNIRPASHKSCDT